MTKPQQTIGNTVYTVGQELHTMTEAGPFIDAWVEANKRNGYAENPVSKGHNAYPVSRINSSTLPLVIELLPNPDPVEDEWRVVVHPDKRAGGYPEALQEVCKANEVKLEWPEWLPFDAAYFPDVENDRQYALEVGIPTAAPVFPTKYDVKEIITCFLLGGTVKVRGGL
jgi:hypothetical protein